MKKSSQNVSSQQKQTKRSKPDSSSKQQIKKPSGKQPSSKLINNIPVPGTVMGYLQPGQYHNLSLVSKSTKKKMEPHEKQLPIKQQLDQDVFYSVKHPKQYVQKIVNTLQGQRRPLAQKIKNITISRVEWNQQDNPEFKKAFNMIQENVSKFRNLKALKVNGSDSSQFGLKIHWPVIAEQVSRLKHLETLDICDDEAGAVGAHAMKTADARLIAGAISKLTNLKELIVADQRLSPEGMTAIVDSINHLPHLKKLVLVNNPAGGEAGAVALGNIHIQLPELQVFEFIGNNIGDQGAIGISRFLTKAFKLKTFTLSHNERLINAGLVAIIRKLPDLRYLKTLDFSYTPIADDGATALSHVFRDMVSLENFNLNSTMITLDGVIAITNTLNLSPALKKFCYSNSFIVDWIYADSIIFAFCIMITRNRGNINFKLEYLNLVGLKIYYTTAYILCQAIDYFVSTFPANRKFVLHISGQHMNQQEKNDLLRRNNDRLIVNIW